jgi:hypothetical protein
MRRLAFLPLLSSLVFAVNPDRETIGPVGRIRHCQRSTGFICYNLVTGHGRCLGLRIACADSIGRKFRVLPALYRGIGLDCGKELAAGAQVDGKVRQQVDRLAVGLREVGT